MKGAHPFSISKALQFAFHTVVDHIILMLGIMATAGIINIIRFGIAPAIFLLMSFFLYHASYTPLTHPLWALYSIKFFIGAFIVFFIFKLMDSVFSLGFSHIALLLYDNERISYKDLFACTHLAIKHFIASLLNACIVTLGLLFFIIPGIIALVRLGFFSYIIADKGLGPLAALQESYRLTTGITTQLLGVLLIIILLNSLGGALFGIGLFLTYPITVLLYAYIYRQLQGH